MLKIDTSVRDEVSFLLDGVEASLQDRTDLCRAIARDATRLTREHLYEIAPMKHKTAERLGATPTGYLSIIAELLRPAFDSETARVDFPTDGPEIFARVDGPVTIYAKRVKNLAIAACAAAYGKRPVTIPGLRFVPFPSGAKALVMPKATYVPGKRKPLIKKIENTVYFWLVPKVTVPQDASLLPTQSEYAESASAAINNFYVERFLNG